MESTNINAVLQQRIALRKKQKEERIYKEKEEEANRKLNENANEYILTEEEQAQLDEDLKQEAELMQVPENGDLDPKTDFLNPSVLRRKLITYLHQLLINQLPDLALKKLNIDETKRLEEENYGSQNTLPNPVVVYEKSLSLAREIKMDILPLLVKLQTDSLESEIMVSLGTVIFELQNSNKTSCLQAYLDLSIGKVVWPIGIQNIGIHFKTTGKEDQRDKANFLKEGDWIIALKRVINMKFME